MADQKIKGIILAGGLGTRLYPATLVTNKHLLNVYDKPMIFYPIKTLVDAGIKELMIVTGGNSAGDFLRLLGNGHSFGLKNIQYAYQKGEGGIADALKLAEAFADNSKIVVMLGDNVVEKNIKSYVQAFRKQQKGARILLKESDQPQRFGVADIKNNRILKIVEKPKNPKSNLIVTGIYMYDSQVFDIAKTLKPSKRGELEISDVNNKYIKNKQMRYDILDGWWSDCGTFDSLLHASNLIAQKR